MKRPNTTQYKAVQKVCQNYRVDSSRGLVFNARNEQVGSPQNGITAHLNGIKANARLNKVIGFVKYGSAALEKGVQIRHIDGNIYNNSDTNLELVRTPVVRGNLTPRQIRRVRTLWVGTLLSTGEISTRVGASRHQVRRIVNGQAHTAVQ